MGTLKTVNISAIRPVVDHNEITLHFLKVLELNMPQSTVFIVMRAIFARLLSKRLASMPRLLHNI